MLTLSPTVSEFYKRQLQVLPFIKTYISDPPNLIYGYRHIQILLQQNSVCPPLTLDTLSPSTQAVAVNALQDDSGTQYTCGIIYPRAQFGQPLWAGIGRSSPIVGGVWVYFSHQLPLTVGFGDQSLIALLLPWPMLLLILGLASLPAETQ